MKMTCSGEAAVPRVSVFLPVRNGGAFLDRALASLKAQTLEDWECVAVDDGSEDDTWARLQAWAAADRRFRLARIPHGGIVAALHAALAASSPTPYIARLDADDECHPERLARQTAFLEARPEVGLVGCRVRFGGDPLLAHGFKTGSTACSRPRPFFWPGSAIRRWPIPRRCFGVLLSSRTAGTRTALSPKITNCGCAGWIAERAWPRRRKRCSPGTIRPIA